MKSIKTFLTVALLIVLGGLSAQAVRLNESEKQAQRSLVEFLRSKKFAPSIDSNDQTVCFKKDGTLYWISVKGDANRMLYSLYRNGIRFAKADDPRLSCKAEVAMMAANKLNETRIIKSYQSGGVVRFCLPMYAKSPEDFEAVFALQMRAFDDIKQDFDRNYKLCKHKVDSIHNYWYDLDTTVVVVNQRNVANTAPARNLSISRISVRNVDANDGIISDYDQGVRKSKCEFLQEKVYLKADKAGMYKIGVRLYYPDGKLMVPARDARFTTITTINVPKANKEGAYDLLKFGSKDSEIWEPGEYKIEFFEDDTCIYTDAINIL